MELFKKNESKKIGEIIGFVFGYFLFTTIIFLIFLLTNKLPFNWGYFHFPPITFGIFLIGLILKNKILK